MVLLWANARRASSHSWNCCSSLSERSEAEVKGNVSLDMAPQKQDLASKLRQTGQKVDDKEFMPVSVATESGTHAIYCNPLTNWVLLQ